MSDDRNGGPPDEIEGRVRDAFESAPSASVPDEGLASVSRRARRIRAGRAGSVVVASLVVAVAIAGPLIAFGGIGGPNANVPAVAPTGAGTLDVALVLDRPGPLYIEGAIGFVRVETVGGELIRETHGPYGERVTLRIELPPGTYRVVGYLRPCNGHCGLLDSPTDSCAATARVAVGAVTRAMAHVRVGKGCAFTVLVPRSAQVSGATPPLQGRLGPTGCRWCATERTRSW
jgi:hypothetical protein